MLIQSENKAWLEAWFWQTGWSNMYSTVRQVNFQKEKKLCRRWREGETDELEPGLFQREKRKIVWKIDLFQREKRKKENCVEDGERHYRRAKGVSIKKIGKLCERCRGRKQISERHVNLKKRKLLGRWREGEWARGRSIKKTRKLCRRWK